EAVGVMSSESVKSAALLSVSIPSVRWNDGASALLEGAAAAAVSKVFDVPYPSRSTTTPPVVTEPGARDCAVVTFASRIVPVVPEGLIEPETSGVGRSAPFVPFEPPATRKYPPAGIVPLSGVTPVNEPVPVAERYCKDHPVRSTSVSVGLNSSTNLRLNCAPELPPDRNASLMTPPEPSGAAIAGWTPTRPRPTARPATRASSGRRKVCRVRAARAGDTGFSSLVADEVRLGGLGGPRVNARWPEREHPRSPHPSGARPCRRSPPPSIRPVRPFRTSRAC